MRRNATLFVLISLLSGFGSTAMMLAAGVWILDLTGSVGLAALTGICIYAPTLASPWLGLLVDRLPRRPMLIAVDLTLGAALFTLLTVRSVGDVWLIFAVLLARGVGYVLVDAGESAILPALLPPSRLGDVNGWRSSAQEGMKLVAPLAGAGLYAWRGPVPVILLSAAMPLLTAACYALVRARPAVGRAEPDQIRMEGGAAVDRNPGAGRAGADRDLGAGRAGADRDLGAGRAGADRDRVAGAAGAGPAGVSEGGRARGVRAGLQALFTVRAVRVPVLAAAAAIALSGMTNAAVLARLVHGLQLPATHLGFLATAQGAGSIVGGLLVGRLLARSTPATVAAVGALLFAAGCATWCLPWWPTMIAGSVLVGLGLPWTLIAAVTAVQTSTPEHLLGRVAATSNMLMFGPVALAVPLGSALVELGGRPPLLAAAALALVTSGLVVRGRRGRAGPGDQRPGGARSPAPGELSAAAGRPR